MWRSGGARAGDANKAAPVFGVAELGGRQKEPGRAGAGLPAKGFFQAVFKEPPRRAALSGNTLFGRRWLSSPGAGAQPARRQGPSPALMGKKITAGGRCFLPKLCRGSASRAAAKPVELPRQIPGRPVPRRAAGIPFVSLGCSKLDPGSWLVY